MFSLPYTNYKTKENFSKLVVAAIIAFGIGGIFIASVNQNGNQEVQGQNEERIVQPENPPQNIKPEEEQNVETQNPDPEEETNNLDNSNDSTTELVFENTYTNPSYPNLRLPYPNQWNFTTFTTQSSYEGLANREIKLTKGDSVLTFRFELASNQRCAFNAPATKQQELLNGLARFNIPSQNTIQYGLNNQFSNTCDFRKHILQTSIPSLQFNQEMNSNIVFAWVFIELQTNNPQHIKQADEIVSKLQTSSTIITQ